jgi:large subunit ribosomal protein L13
MKEHTLDVTDIPFGRAASEVAKVLLGKNRPNFAPNIVTDEIIYVENLDKIKIPATKIRNKYYRHSGYLGNLKTTTLGERVEKDLPGFFRSTVKGMLPDNKLREARLKRLKIR